MGTTESTHVIVDVTAAQAGRGAVIQLAGGPVDKADDLTADQALLLSDDLRRAAPTAEQLYDEFGDDRDPTRRRPPVVSAPAPEEPF